MILHTNDTHSNIDTGANGAGGILPRKAIIDSVRKAEKNVLLVDAGDMVQGTLYFKFFKGDVEYPIFNMMKYDIRILGNHEFDNGLDQMARYWKDVKSDRLSANYDFTGTCVEGLVKPYVIIKRNGLKIGLFGLSPQLKGLVDLSKCKGVTYLDPIEVGNRVAAELKHDKRCDVVICVSHLGWLRPDEMGDQKLLASSKDIDLVLGGHSHSYFKSLRYVNNADGKAVPVDQNGKNAMYVGKLTLSFDKK